MTRRFTRVSSAYRGQWTDGPAGPVTYPHGVIGSVSA